MAGLAGVASLATLLLPLAKPVVGLMPAAGGRAATGIVAFLTSSGSNDSIKYRPNTGLAALLGDEDCMDAKAMGQLSHPRTQR